MTKLIQIVQIFFQLCIGIHASNKVSLVVLAESKCPDCVEFIKGPLKNTLQSEGIPDAIEFDFVPWGNAYVNIEKCGGGGFEKSHMFCWADECLNDPSVCFQGDIICQHGKKECLGNAVQACAIQQAGNYEVYMPFIECFEGKHQSDLNYGAKCAQEANLDWKSIQLCFQGPERKALEQKNALKTLKYAGDKKLGTPWVMVNGHPISNYNTVLREVCKAIEQEITFRGTLPKACRADAAVE